MCIRDREARIPCDVEELLALVAPRPALVITPRIDYQSSFCLLYTSDAADERSSVDLGGRRIIKKKKTCMFCGTLVLSLTAIYLATITHIGF